MASSNKSIWAVVAVAAVVGLGGAVYLVRFISEHTSRGVSHSQVNEWAEVWTQTRACLTGDTPRLTRGSHALLMFEATRPTSLERLKGCDRFLRVLARPGDESTGEPIIEERWSEVRTATSELARRFAYALTPASPDMIAQRRSRLAAAIDGVDEAYAGLRQAANLPPAPPPGSEQAVELSTGTSISPANDAIRAPYEEDTETTPAGNKPPSPEVAGTPPEVAGTSPEVAGTPSEGTPPEVAGTPSEGTPPEVAGTPPEVAGTPPEVAGTPGTEVAGTPPEVAGTSPEVAGTPPEVAGAPPEVQVRGNIVTVKGLGALVVVRGPTDFERYQNVANTTMRAADTSSWGLWFESDAAGRLDLKVGSLDVTGQPENKGMTVASTTNRDEDLVARFALGAPAGRAVLFDMVGDAAGKTGLFMVRSVDNGATWSRPVLLAEHPLVFDGDVARRRFHMAWLDADGAVRRLAVHAETLDAGLMPGRLFEVGGTPPEGGAPGISLCAAEKASFWLHDGRTLYQVAEDRAAARRIAEPDTLVTLTRCNDRGAVLTAPEEDGVTVHRCDDRRCEPAMTVPVTPDGHLAVGIRETGEPVVLTQTNELVLLWRPGAEPVAFLAADGHTVAAVVEWDGRIHAVMHAAAKGVYLVALPAQ